jgi:threonine dehydrogenase-like Zn-dependent dehydrogenase
MRAAVIAAPREIRVETLPIPEPADGQVRVRLEGSGVCHSNLPIWEGREWFQYPMPPGNPGHEGWGRVDGIGRGVNGTHEGQRVAFLSSAAYAEYDVVPHTSVVAIPGSLDSQPFPGEPLGCALNIFRRAEVREGQTVAIIGVGFLGALLCQLASRAGARVIAIARRPFAQDLARRFGAHMVVAMDDHGRIIEQVREATHGRFCERVIECVGAQWPLDLAGELTGERGRLVIAGFHQDGPRQVNLFLWNWRGIDVVNAHERDPARYVEGMREAVRLAAAGVLDVERLVTHRFPLARLGDAFEAARTRPKGFVKAWVTP